MQVIARKSRLFRVALCLAVSAFGLVSSAHAAPGDLIQIKVLSNRPDFVSGGDALVEMVLPAGLSAAGLQVGVARTAAGPFTMISGSFSTRADGRTLGLVTGLANGTNYVVAKHLRGGGGQLQITNHPIGGP